MEEAQHLIDALKQDYTITIDWDTTKYIGLTLEWEKQELQGLCPHARIYPKGTTLIQAPITKNKTELSASTCKTPIWSQSTICNQRGHPPPLTGEEAKYVQEVAGTLLYYARAVDSTILPALSAIATKQANPMEKTSATIKQLLDYWAMQDKAVLAYKASNMILAVHSDAGYFNEKKLRSQAGGHFFLSNKDEFPPYNSAILIVATIIKAVMSLAAEAELGALYLNAKEAVYL